MTDLSIFFDLETTSLHPLGQILNFCFIAVDRNWNEVRRLTGRVKVSPLQLPEPGAIDVTNTDIFEHQSKATYTEKEAVALMYSFFCECKALNDAKLPVLIGQNSSNFDLDFLRTTFIRNGVSPYGLFEPKDILLLSRYLFATNEQFRNRIPPVTTVKKGKDTLTLSLSLQHLARAFGFLSGDQLHESTFDVELSILLAKFYVVEFSSDVRSFNSYRIKKLHDATSSAVLITEFKQSLTEPYQHSWKLFLREEGNAAFWVKLDASMDPNIPREAALKAVRRYKFHGHLLWKEHDTLPPSDVQDLAVRIRNILGHVTADELFGASNCYIEQFIYRIAPNQHSILFDALNKAPQLSSDLSADIITLARRYWLENCPDCDKQSDEYQNAFRNYALYRYGGKLQLKNLQEGEEPTENIYHPTLSNLLADIEQRKQKPEKKAIFDKLQQFYLNSEVVKSFNR